MPEESVCNYSHRNCVSLIKLNIRRKCLRLSSLKLHIYLACIEQVPVRRVFELMPEKGKTHLMSKALIYLLETTFNFKSNAISKESTCDYPHRNYISFIEQEKIKRKYL